MRSKFLVCLLSVFFLAGSALAIAQPGTDEAAVKAAVEKKFPGMKIDSLQKTPYGELYEAVMAGNQIFYTDKNANYILVGNLIDAKTQRNVTEARMRDLTQVKFDTLPLAWAIKQVKGNGKRKMAVFSDPDCPFCKRLDAELAKVTDVTIYIFLYPIASLHPQSADKARGGMVCVRSRQGLGRSDAEGNRAAVGRQVRKSGGKNRRTGQQAQGQRYAHDHLRRRDARSRHGASRQSGKAA